MPVCNDILVRDCISYPANADRIRLNTNKLINMIKKQMGCKSLIILIILVFPTLLKGQADTVKYPILDLTVETGVFFPRSEDFQNIYNSKSTFNWSVGTKFGASDWNYIPWIKYSQYQSKIDSLISNDVDNDSIINAKRNQISMGIVHPIKLKDNNFIQLKCGISYNFISEELTGLY